MDDNKDYLSHYGVKGMKWKQHKKQNNVASGVLSGMGYRAPNDARAHGLAKIHYSLNTKHGARGKQVSKAISNQYQKGVRKGQRKSVARSRRTTARGAAAMSKLLKKTVSSPFKHSDELTDVLIHHGIKGMRWGVRRTPEQLGHKDYKNPNYTEKQRQRDRQFYGKGGERRINRKLNDGQGLQSARNYESDRLHKARNTATSNGFVGRIGGGAIGGVIGVGAPSFYKAGAKYVANR